ncbi:UDP-glucuronate:xylan alpha-glucuronosyltransferase 1-like [Asparagus officinalis]|nr:UDP-glucuronate:xylan alpha-glucuronosyltransferase 1-like [Asparagus officinalis]
MRGTMGLSPNSAEARHRTTGSFDEANKRRHQRRRDFKEAEKLTFAIPERIESCKFRSLKLVLFIITCGTLLTLLCSPAVNNDHVLHSGKRSRLVDVGWIWDKAISDSRYESHLDTNWTQISKAMENLDATKGKLKLGLLNFNVAEVNNWQQLLPHAESSIVHLDYAKSNLTWEDLYPEWIDEEQESEVPICPTLPEPKSVQGFQFDLIAVKLPCNRTAKNWSRDIARFHLQLAAAKLAADSGNVRYKAHVLFVTDCFPIPNLFSCKNLVVRNEDTWLYRPDLSILREKLKLPVGSCQLAIPLNEKVRPLSDARKHREAYATILHSANIYVCGAITAAQSIRTAGSTKDLVILVDNTISDHHKSGLQAAGWKVRSIQRIRNPKAERDAYNEWNYSKFRLWQLTDYDKIIFIDADLLILRNIDFLFTMPEITATGNNATLFNSGVMVLEPSNCTFNLLMEHINEIESYNGGDQGYLNEIFTWWHRIPKHMNFLKNFWVGDEEEMKSKKIQLFGADPPILYVLHYLGYKPWLCFRDYDCNWNIDILQEFASDVAHARWWRVHDAMPENLQRFCLLRSKQKAGLEWDRRQAEKAKYADGHWKRNITDPRLSICYEKFCFWESMLWHWGETNWTDNSPSTMTPPIAALPSL